MTSSFLQVFDTPGAAGSLTRSFDAGRGDEQSAKRLFRFIDDVMRHSALDGHVHLTTIELDLDAGRFPEVVQTYFSSAEWDYRERYSLGEVCKADAADTFRHGRLTFEAHPDLTWRLLTNEAGYLRWGAALQVGGVQVAEADVATALRQSPFSPDEARILEPLARVAWAVNQKLTAASIWVRGDEAPLLDELSALR
jgi:hypothetical protein